MKSTSGLSLKISQTWPATSLTWLLNSQEYRKSAKWPWLNFESKAIQTFIWYLLKDSPIATPRLPTNKLRWNVTNSITRTRAYFCQFRWLWLSQVWECWEFHSTTKLIFKVLWQISLYARCMHNPKFLNSISGVHKLAFLDTSNFNLIRRTREYSLQATCKDP